MDTKYLFAFIGLLFLSGTPLAAQTDSTATASKLITVDTTQKKEGNLVQFSGIIVAGDNLEPVPFTNIAIKSTYRGTSADAFGYFSFVAREGDTIIFSAVGFRRAEYAIPDSMEDSRYSLIQMMQKDTILLKETVIYPWPTPDDFKRAFLALDLPDDAMDRARNNLDRERLAEMGKVMPMDASENFRYNMQQEQTRLYYAGQAPPNNLLNPLAWAKFIEAWKNGDFKKDDP